ncbi:hypothetical protein [Phenylobacterium aquaticum]|uniref:hypothetical protein n=1 Tax=Phenylobacterium aquaticum TaxID=1763816 RepID=UPI0026EE83CA|nr:hypothetical protein [Phenylobacterium aquaticum]
MTLDGFLAAFALAAAIYAVIPSVHRLRATLALWPQALLAFVSLSLVLYLEYFRYLGQPCWLSSQKLCQIITLQQADQPQEAKDFAFLVVLVWAVIAVAIYRTAKPGPTALAPMRRLVDDLNYERRYAELIGLIEPHLNFIAKASRRGLPVQRLSDQLEIWRQRGTEAGEWMALLRREEPKADTGWATWRRALPVLGRLGACVPGLRKAEEAAGDIIRVLMSSPGLLNFVVGMRPYFGLSLLKSGAQRSSDYCYSYLTKLIEEPGSILYYEIEHNQNLSKGGRYALLARNRILHYLFSDARRAETLGVWKPIGDHTLTILRGGRDYLARLNRPPHQFDVECLKDPVWVATSFFEIMVHEAAHQGIRWHMWLYYMPEIVKLLVENYNESSDVDPDDEFPTFGCRLIYEIFDGMGEWVGMIRDLPKDSHHRQVQCGLNGDNGNIPKSAALAIGRALVPIVMSDSLNHRFAQTMVEVVVRDIRDLYPEGETQLMRAALVEAVANGGSSWTGSAFPRRLSVLLRQIDPLLVGDVEDLTAAIREAALNAR